METALWARSSRSVLMVVSEGMYEALSLMPSKPMTATSRGTEIPHSCNPRIMPRAMESVMQNTPSKGKSPWAAREWARDRAESSSQGSSPMKESGDRVLLPSSRASRHPLNLLAATEFFMEGSSRMARSDPTTPMRRHPWASRWATAVLAPSRLAVMTLSKTGRTEGSSSNTTGLPWVRAFISSLETLPGLKMVPSQSWLVTRRRIETSSSREFMVCWMMACMPWALISLEIAALIWEG